MLFDKWQFLLDLDMKAGFLFGNEHVYYDFLCVPGFKYMNFFMCLVKWMQSSWCDLPNELTCGRLNKYIVLYFELAVVSLQFSFPMLLVPVDLCITDVLHKQDDGVLVIPTFVDHPPKVGGKEMSSETYLSPLFSLLSIASLSGCCQVSYWLQSLCLRFPFSTNFLHPYGEL